MPSARLQLVRDLVSRLDPPAQLGGVMYTGEDDLENALVRSPGRPRLQTGKAIAYVYIEVSDVAVFDAS